VREYVEEMYLPAYRNALSPPLEAA